MKHDAQPLASLARAPARGPDGRANPCDTETPMHMVSSEWPTEEVGPAEQHDSKAGAEERAGGNGEGESSMAWRQA